MIKSQRQKILSIFALKAHWLLVMFITFFSGQRSILAQYTSESVLSNGEIYKITTNTDGVYRLDYNFLKGQLQVDVDNINPSNIRLFGNGGGLLNEDIDPSRIDDLLENAIFISGENDNSFDPGDYILFYGQAADQKLWNPVLRRFEAPKNIYSDDVTYFLKIDTEPGLRISDAVPLNNPTYTSTDYDYHLRMEEEKINLLDDFTSASGTGQSWYGDLFKGLRARSYLFDVPLIRTLEDAFIEVVFVARSSAPSTLRIDVENQVFSSNIGSVNVSDPEGRYARIASLQRSFRPQDEQINIEIEFPPNAANNVGWLDYIEVNARRKISMSEGTVIISDHRSLNHDISAFQIDDAEPNTTVWEISSPENISRYSTTFDGTTMTFSYESDALKKFIAFDPDDALSPTAVGTFENQNLHGIGDLDMVVIYHPEFVDAAELFADHRTQHSNLKVEIVDITAVFNEFGSGSKDPVAIRDFVKMLYDQSDQFKYLLLLGDASFDFKNLKGLAENSNLIPTYETKESLDPIRGFPSDDFFGLLSSGEGSSLVGSLDIAIGRLPAKSSQEAMDLIHKIIDYDTNPNRFGDWINEITFIADDEDFNIHLNQADQIAESLLSRHPLYNVEKIYLDAFPQISTAGGELYPDVQAAINNKINKGTSVINYMGHGGSTGFAQERILTINDVSNWSNRDKLPLFVTATCSFTSYDDPDFVTAGERAILNPNGGAIALFTTVRAVYSSSNERLTRAVFDNLFEEVNGRIPPIGEILRIAKNSNAADTLGINARKFLLIGDPSIHLIQPQYEIYTDKINEQLVSNGPVDTMKALEPITIEGYIGADSQIQKDFNGQVNVIIYDKPKTVQTLGQDNTSFPKSFQTRKNIIFKGSATVENGRFSFDFIVPKDIDYAYGNGKISYYAKSDLNSDATGFFNEFVIGGTTALPIQDDMPPQVDVYLNSENFVSGGITNANPTLLLYLQDDNGINIVGNSIGHDITAVIDGDTRGTIILNEFYESQLDNNTAGTVRFPLNDLTEGKHTIEVKAWDIANNSGIGYTEFIVATDTESALNYVLNYPNPIVDQTSFRIDHNISSSLLDITIDIFALDGRLVRSLYYNRGTSAGLIDNLEWDGTNSSGQRLNTGVYLFKVNITDANNPEKAPINSNLEKLVIIR